MLYFFTTILSAEFAAGFNRVRALLIAAMGFACVPPLGQGQVLYKTGFEPEEGYDIKYTLAGQAGWLEEGTGGNGLIEGIFQDLGNQAYIGFGLLRKMTRGT